MPEGSVTLSGFRELDDTFKDLGKALQKGALTRIGRRALQPMADMARELAHERSGALKRAIHVGTRLARSQRTRARYDAAAGGMRQAAQDYVTVYMGPGQQPQAIQEEFGNYRQSPRSYMRVAFAAEAEATIRRCGDDFWPEIEKVAARRARKLARQAGG